MNQLKCMCGQPATAIFGLPKLGTERRVCTPCMETYLDMALRDQDHVSIEAITHVPTEEELNENKENQ